MVLSLKPYVLCCRYEAMIFSMACKGLHHEDAFQVESLLALCLQMGFSLGFVMSFLMELGPWAEHAAEQHHQ